MSQSRKVNGYVKAVRKRNKLERLFVEAQADVTQRLAGLTGGQMAEAKRELAEEE